MNHTLITSERGYNISFYDVFISLGTGLSGLPYSIRHWELSNIYGPQYAWRHRAISVVEALPIVGGLTALIERVIFNAYGFILNCQPSSKPVFDHVKVPSKAVDISIYQKLKEKFKEELIPEDLTLHMTDESGSRNIKLEKFLANGGNKKAFQFERGRVLIIPNIDFKHTDLVAKEWERIVLEEVKMSQILRDLGLLSSLSQRVDISLTQPAQALIPTYTSESFENLGKTKGLFIIDKKKTDACTWKPDKDFLFKTDGERLQEKNWDAVTGTLLTDIVKICFYEIPVNNDSLNIAIVKKPSSEESFCKYEVRHFGFDFSDPCKPLAIPQIIHRPLTPFDKRLHYKYIHWVLECSLNVVFTLEFGVNKNKSAYKELRERLLRKYTSQVLIKMINMSELTQQAIV